MTIVTIATIGTEYPHNIKIDSSLSTNSKWRGYIYLLKDDSIHRLIIDSDSVFETKTDAEKYMTDLCDWCVEYVKNNEVFG